MAVSTFIKTINGYAIRDISSIHGLSASGTTITITKGDGSTDTITTQDTVYTHRTGTTAGTYKSVTVDAEGHVTAGTNPTTIAGYGITDAKIASGTITLGSNTITPLVAASTLDATKLSGTIPASCYTDTVYTHRTGTTAGTYKSVTVDAEGHVTAGTNPTTLAGYGITDAKIASGTITLGSNTITPLVAASTLDATKLSGTVPLSCIPAAALERCVVVADDTARKALTTASVQNGDTVKVTSTGKMYFVKDDTKLSSDAGYEEYAAGTAASVAWSGITDVPNYAGSDSKGGSATSAAKLDSNAGSATQPVYFANGVPVATTYTLAQSVTTDSKLTDHITTAALSTTTGKKEGNVITGMTADANGAITYEKSITALTAASTLDATKLSGTIPATCYTDTVYEHPTHTAATSGLYKVTVDALGHVTATTAVVKKDITDLGIPGSDTNTTYTNGTGLTLTGTTFSANAMTGASASAAGTAGMAPAPAAGAQAKFLRGDATWASIALNITDNGEGDIVFSLATQA